MPNKMLIDATHPEETRVVVLRGNRVEEFDFESANRKQLRGNIYLAKVTRVEPSLQAAFVDYGGNRHGFLAFSEIHPDYYRIPVGDRRPPARQTSAAENGAEGEVEAEPPFEAEAADPPGELVPERSLTPDANGYESPPAESGRALPAEAQDRDIASESLELEPAEREA